MMRNRRVRRVIALGLILLGAMLLWLAPSVQPGLVAFALGVVLELVGLALERGDSP